MNMRRWSLTLALLLLVSCLGGCGGEGDSPAGTIGEGTVPVATLVKSASVAYSGVNPDYDNVIRYRAGSLVGVLNNDGSVRVPAEYNAITVLDEKHFAYRDSSDYIGIVDYEGNVLSYGFYNNIEHVGADYVLLKTMVVCEETHPKMYSHSSETGEYYYLKYSLLSLSEKKEVSCPVLDTINESDDLILWDAMCDATEDNFFVTAYNGYDTDSSVSYAYYWASGKTLTGDLSCYKDGCVNDGAQLYNAKGELIEQCRHDDESRFVEKRDGYKGVVDTSGNVIIPFQYNDIEEYTADIYAVRLGESWGFIDKTGKVLMNPTINDEYKDNDRYFETADNKPCLYNPYTGEKTVYEYLKDLDNDKGTYSAYNGTGRGIVTFEKALTEFVYNENGNSIEVSKDGKVYVAQKGSTYDVFVWE